MKSLQESLLLPGSKLDSFIASTNSLIPILNFIHVLTFIFDWDYWHSFKRLAKETHPDRPNGDKEQFQKLQMAFKRALKTIEVALI